jgi:hypothetical protein
MKCVSCQKKGIYKTTTGSFCARCYTRMLEKRVRKHIRLHKLINPKIKLLCLDEISYYFVNSIYKNARIDVHKIEKVPSRINPNTLFLLPESLDDYVCARLYAQLHGQKSPKRKSHHISILSVLTDKELTYFAEIKGLTFMPQKKDSDVYGFIMAMTYKYPESLYALYNSFLELEK